jgi:serine/threonine protein kinase
MVELPALRGPVALARLAPRAVTEREAVTTGQRLPAIGQWQPTRLIGKGRWTYVYRARPLDAVDSEGGDFAVKILSPQWASDPLARALLEREALVSRKVQHPQLIAILADHTNADTPYLVQPYLEGASLRQVIGCGPRSLSHALFVVRQLAEALAALHAAGWLHGDVKPENVRIAPAGHATLLDLGLARALSSYECLTDHAIAASLPYAAPETFSTADRLTAASDTYSLGVTFLEMLAGGPKGELSPAELAHMHRREAPPDVRELDDSASADLAEIVRRMLAKDPLRRPNAHQLIRQLADAEIDSITA